jgi:hypothetical protein
MIDSAHAPIDKWGLTFVGDELGADDAHVWRSSPDRPADMIAKLEPLLSRDECTTWLYIESWRSTPHRTPTGHHMERV